ncbi:hypothetical protein U1Q18_015014 [Sarracenia purpurea var. burkii]
MDDMTRMSVQINLVDTQFGIGSPNILMPINISPVQDGIVCPEPTLQALGTEQRNLLCRAAQPSVPSSDAELHGAKG